MTAHGAVLQILPCQLSLLLADAVTITMVYCTLLPVCPNSHWLLAVLQQLSLSPLACHLHCNAIALDPESFGILLAINCHLSFFYIADAVAVHELLQMLMLLHHCLLLAVTTTHWMLLYLLTFVTVAATAPCTVSNGDATSTAVATFCHCWLIDKFRILSMLSLPPLVLLHALTVAYCTMTSCC